jgi:hypothetical protein
MIIQKTIVFVCIITAALLMDSFIINNSNLIYEVARSQINNFFPDSSIYRNRFFLDSIFRYILSISVISFFMLLIIFLRKSDAKFSEFFVLNPLSIISLILLFMYMNYFSNNDEIIYSILSYISIIFLVFRENVLFVSQVLFSSDRKVVFITSILSLFIFIYLHPFAFTIGSLTGTMLMVNIWIYTTIRKNIWIGVTLHAIWNLAFPESMWFHMAVLTLSFFLVFRVVIFQKEFSLCVKSFILSNFKSIRFLKKQ